MSAVHFYDESLQKSATEYVELAVSDVIEDISGNEKISKTTKDHLLKKLRSVKLSVMFPKHVLNLTKIEEWYDGLDFEGNETEIDLFMKFDAYYYTLFFQPQEQWRLINDIVNEPNVRYFFDTNVLCEL